MQKLYQLYNMYENIFWYKAEQEGMFLSSFPTDLRNVAIEMSHVTNSWNIRIRENMIEGTKENEFTWQKSSSCAIQIPDIITHIHFLTEKMYQNHDLVCKKLG